MSKSTNYITYSNLKIGEIILSESKTKERKKLSVRSKIYVIHIQEPHFGTSFGGVIFICMEIAKRS